MYFDTSYHFYYIKNPCFFLALAKEVRFVTVCMESPGCKCFTHGACDVAAYSLGNGLPFCRDSFERFILMKTIA